TNTTSGPQRPISSLAPGAATVQGVTPPRGTDPHSVSMRRSTLRRVSSGTSAERYPSAPPTTFAVLFATRTFMSHHPRQAPPHLATPPRQRRVRRDLGARSRTPVRR